MRVFDAVESKNDLIKSSMRQLSLDLACQPEDFLKDENTVVLSRQWPGRRAFSAQNDFFRLATFGKGCVASVDRQMFPFAKALLERLPGIEVFDAKGVYVINDALKQYRRALGGFHQYYLPRTSLTHPYTVLTPPGAGRWRLQLLEEDQVPRLYTHTEFTDALMFRQEGRRRDVLAIAAYHGQDPVGLAGASNDSEKFWQIGIHVLPAYRRQGIAALLVSTLTKEILSRGAIPYYGTWWSNIASQNVALRCGYFPVWAETYGVSVE